MKIFSKAKYLEERGYSGKRAKGGWADLCDGKKVKGNMCGIWLIADEWCIEVPDKPVQPKMHVLIDCDDGKITTARLLVNGKEVKRATARLDKRDEFNFRIGAEIAFKRLFAKKKGE